MALDNNDLLAVQKAGGGENSVRRALVSEFVNLVAISVSTIWTRSGTDISPTNDGDNLIGVGDIQATTATFAGALGADTGTFAGALEAESIDGGFQDLGGGEIDYPDP